MPWWLYTYFVGYAVFTYFWVRDDIREGGSRPLLIAEFLSDCCMVLVGLGYWLEQVRSILGSYAPIIFAAGLAWLIIAAIRGIRETWPINDTPFVQVGTALGVLLVYGVICGPLLYWGFSYAMLGATSGT